MRKALLLLCVLIIAFTFSSCGKKEFNQYKVGDIGPAGGYVFYDKGFYSDGWRYIEAAPADLKVIDGAPSVNVHQKGYANGRHASFVFGLYTENIKELDYLRDTDMLYVNGKKTFDKTNCTDTAVGSGENNTRLLVKAMGKNGVDYDPEAERYYITVEYAAKLCDDLKFRHDGITYRDWFLPSLDELKLMYEKKDEIGGFTNYPYWSSSESDEKSIWTSSACLAWTLEFHYGYWDSVNRGHEGSVRPVRYF